MLLLKTREEAPEQLRLTVALSSDCHVRRLHRALQTEHVPPFFEQCLQYLQFLQAVHVPWLMGVHVAVRAVSPAVLMARRSGRGRGRSQRRIDTSRGLAESRADPTTAQSR